MLEPLSVENSAAVSRAAKVFQQKLLCVPPRQLRHGESPSIPTSRLRASPATLSAIDQHIKAVGLDTLDFLNTPESQGKHAYTRKNPYLNYEPPAESAFRVLIDHDLHIPHTSDPELERDIASKMAVRWSRSTKVNRKKLRASDPDAPPFTRRVYIMQCMCGSDHQSGHHAAITRQMPWRDVQCTVCMRVTCTFDGERSPLSS